MRLIFITIIFLTINSEGLTQKPCVGPLSLKIKGSTTGEPLIVEFESFDIFCSDLDEGAIELMVDGGSPEYFCLWNTGEVGDSLLNLQEGTYSVTVTDENDCLDSVIVEIKSVDPFIDDMYLTDADGCGTCTLSDGGESYFYYDDKYMVYIQDVIDNYDIGDVEVCTELHPFTLYEDNNPLLRRSWCVNSEGGKAKLKLYFTDEERTIFMNDCGIDEIKPTNLFVRNYNASIDGTDEHESITVFNDIQFFPLDDDSQIWYVEFIVENLEEGNNCFYIEYLKDESETYIGEIRSLVEQATYSINNPAVDQLILRMDGINALVQANIYIEDEAQKLVYYRKYENHRMVEEIFDVSNFQSAIYYLTIEFPKPRYTKTLKFAKIGI